MLDNKIEFTLPEKLRDRNIHQNVTPTTCNLRILLKKIKLLNGDVSQLKHWEKRCYMSYQLQDILDELLSSQPEDWSRIIKRHILKNDPTYFGAHCIDIYLVAYVTTTYTTGIKTFVEYVKKSGISQKENSARSIWQVGRGDGVYLDILRENGSIKDWNFFSRWISGDDNGQKKE